MRFQSFLYTSMALHHLSVLLRLGRLFTSMIPFFSFALHHVPVFLTFLLLNDILNIFNLPDFILYHLYFIYK